MRADPLRPWRPSAGGWNRSAAAHLFARAGFGAAPGELERALERGFDATLEELLARDAHDPALVEGVRALLPAGEIEHLQSWWMALLLGGGAPLRERMTLFWHDHFATSWDKVRDVRLMHAQNELFRDHGLGDFRALLHAVARDPAMLVWLDGDDNVAGRPNENFAREVMELFALGIGHYTEKDVQEAARAFTGWGTQGRAFRFRPSAHDGGEKTVFGRRGAFHGEDVIDLVLARPACPRHLARRLLEEFVHPEPAEHEVDALARVLLDEEWNLGRTLRRLFASELFFAPRARRARVVGPVELVVATVRRLGARVAPRRAVEAAVDMAQSLFRPPTVKGWDGMRTWIDAGTWVARHNALVSLAAAHRADEDGVRVDLRAAFGDPSHRGEVGRRVAAALVPGLEDRGYLEIVEGAAAAAGDVDEALVLCTALVLSSPEYHLT